jgi:hypothetical protein
MSREEIEKLLGGYATGTLTAEEQQALFEAALDDQALFDALAHEQVLRDLLRDPAAKATVLAQLDGGTGHGWKTWVRRPWVAGLAMAAVAAIAVGVWQFGRKPVEKQVLVAENRPMKTAPPAAEVLPATPPPPVAVTPPRRMVEEKHMRVVPSPPQPAATSASLRDKDAAKEQIEVAAQAPVPAEKKSLDQNQQVQVLAQAPVPPSPSQQATQNQTLGASVAVPAAQPQDARVLFYEPQLPPSGRMTFAPQQEDRVLKAEGGGSMQRSAKKGAVAGAAGAVTLGGRVTEALAALYPGVRCSIVRGGNEADPSTPLSVGEAVKLKLIPNVDGFLYVMEDDRVVAGSRVRRMVAFETQELKSDAPAERHFRITLTRAPMAPDALAEQATVSRANLVESKGEREAATYMVQTGNATAAQQVVVPVTLAWR